MILLSYAILLSSLLVALPLLGYRRKWKEAEAKHDRMREYWRGKRFRKRRLGTKIGEGIARGGKRLRPRYKTRS